MVDLTNQKWWIQPTKNGGFNQPKMVDLTNQKWWFNQPKMVDLTNQKWWI